MEAMATKTPIIVPNNTCFTEIIGSKEQRGYLVDCGNNVNNWDIMPNDNDVIRPVVDVNSLIEKMVHVYDNRDEAAKKADVAYNWVCSNLNWEKHIVPKWLQLIASGLNILNGDSLPVNVNDKEVSLLNSFVL
jgi:glycosyltransferase involved in cell wall biosynthesis